MKFAELMQYLKQDGSRWSSKSSIFRLYLTNREYRIVARHRVCTYLSGRRWLFPLYCVERFLYHRLTTKCGCDMPSHVQVGAGFQLLHTWGTVINSATIIGTNCTVLTGTVIGKNHTGVPVIGNNVFIGAHAIIIGDIHVGDGAVIGAGAIVTHDVPPGAIVIGKAASVK